MIVKGYRWRRIEKRNKSSVKGRNNIKYSVCVCACVCVCARVYFYIFIYVFARKEGPSRVLCGVVYCGGELT